MLGIELIPAELLQMAFNFCGVILGSFDIGERVKCKLIKGCLTSLPNIVSSSWTYEWKVGTIKKYKPSGAKISNGTLHISTNTTQWMGSMLNLSVRTRHGNLEQQNQNGYSLRGMLFAIAKVGHTIVNLII